jgi:hypothetical protein
LKKLVYFVLFVVFLLSLIGCGKKYNSVNIPADLAENNAGQWTTWSEDNKPIRVSNDMDIKVNGSASIKAVFYGAFDNYIRFSAGEGNAWDLTNIKYIRFSIYADNKNENAFQNCSIKLGHDQKYFMWQGPAALFTQANGNWKEFTIPVTGSTEWEYFNTWGANLGKINYFELHVDTWGYDPYSVWIDNIRFELGN